MKNILHGIKGFVIPTKSFVKIGITKIFCYTTTKCLVLSTKRLVAAAKFLVAATKNLFVVPNFVAVTKPFLINSTSSFGRVFRRSISVENKQRREQIGSS